MFVERLLEVRTTELVYGDIIAKKVLNRNGTILIVENTKLNDVLITGLNKNQIPSVYVYRTVSIDRDTINKNIDINELIYQEATKLVEQSIEKLIKKCKNTEQIKSIVLQGIKEESTLKLLKKLRGIGEYRFKNAINVAVLAVTIAKEMKYPLNRLSVLCTASLLHDIGMTKIPKEILNKTEALTLEQRVIIKNHTEYSAEMINETKKFNLEISKIISQHHERFDGTGYPQGETNEYIHVMSKIIAVCDVFDAMINDRPHRSRYKKSESIEFLLGTGNFYFNNEIVNALIESVVVYRFGQWLELSTGETGIVVNEDNEDFSLRPKLVIYFDGNGTELDEPKELDLSLRENIHIYINRDI